MEPILEPCCVELPEPRHCPIRKEPACRLPSGRHQLGRAVARWYDWFMASLEDEIEFEFYRSPGPGGQKKNTTDSAVRARHVPTGIVVVATSERSQLRNKQAAVEEIARRLAELRKKRTPRVPTRPTLGSQTRRVESKKKRAEIKKLRGTPDSG